MYTPKYVKNCTTCHGTGTTNGVTMTIYCFDCHGVGFLHLDSSVQEIATGIDLGHEIRRLQQLLRAERAKNKTSQHTTQYARNNSRGPGGSCFTGD